MSQTCFRLLSERYLTSEIDFVRWNPKFDLLSIATKRGDVILQRLFWKKAWQISSKTGGGDGAPSIDENSTTATNSGNPISVSSLSWSPSGNYLAIYYSTGKIVFVEIESGRIVYNIDRLFTNGGVSKWVGLKSSVGDGDGSTKTKNGGGVSTTTTNGGSNLFVDDGEEALFALPPMNKSKGGTTMTTTAASILSSTIGGGGESSATFVAESRNDQHPLSLFIVGDIGGQLRLFLNGFFHMADLNLRTSLIGRSDLEKTGLSPIALDVTTRLDRLAVLVCKETEFARQEFSLAIFKTPLSFDSSSYWIRLSKRVSYLSSALRYVETISQKIVDSWEDAVVELDTKLTKFARSKPNNCTETIGDDFLQLLVYGIASPELEHFMSHSLTDKGLKKLLGSMENSYQNLFALLGVNMDCSVSALYHHLTSLKKLMADDEGDDVWTECVETVAGLSLRITHLYDMAESNARSIGLFIRWLHRCVLTVSDDTLPSNLSNFSDEDIDNVVKIIEENFCKSLKDAEENDSSTAAQFGLEKLSPYLKPGSELPSNAAELVNDYSKVIIPFRRLDHLSLPDCVKWVRQCIDKVQNRLSTIFSRRFELIDSPYVLASRRLPTTSSSSTSPTIVEKLDKNLCLVHDAEKRCFRIIHAVDGSSHDLFINEFDEETAAIRASWRLCSSTHGFDRRVINVDLYTAKIVTALVREKIDGDENDWRYVLYQIDTGGLETPAMPSSPSKAAGGTPRRVSKEPISVGWDEMKHQSLSDGQFSMISVSGTRKVGCLVFSCRTRVKLLEFEASDVDTTADTTSLAAANQSSMEVETE